MAIIYIFYVSGKDSQTCNRYRFLAWETFLLKDSLIEEPFWSPSKNIFNPRLRNLFDPQLKNLFEPLLKSIFVQIVYRSNILVLEEVKKFKHFAFFFSFLYSNYFTCLFLLGGSLQYSWLSWNNLMQRKILLCCKDVLERKFTRIHHVL